MNIDKIFRKGCQRWLFCRKEMITQIVLEEALVYVILFCGRHRIGGILWKLFDSVEVESREVLITGVTRTVVCRWRWRGVCDRILSTKDTCERPEESVENWRNDRRLTGDGNDV